jgi:type I restriction enzyme S subunit
MAGEWQRHDVSQLIDAGKLFIGDGYRAKNEELATSGLPFARAGNIKDGFQFDDADHFPEGDLSRVGNKVSQPGDVVFTSKGTVGRFAFVHANTPRFVYSPQLCFWRSLDPGVIEPRFLFYWMFGREFYVQFKGVAGQTDMAEYVSLADQRRMHMTLPPVREQRTIAHILGTLDDKIELNRRMSETLEAIARALFKSWFVDFEPVRAKIAGHDPGLPKRISDQFPDSFEDSVLGEIPKGWKVCVIRDLTENIQYGFTQSASSDRVGPHFLRITDIQGGRVNWATVPFCQVTLEEHERYRLKPGDVLVARTGASTGENIYFSHPPDAIFASYLVRFQFPDLATARLVGSFMRTEAYFDYISGGIGGSAQPNASAQVLAGAQLVVPTPNIARMFADFAVPLDVRSAANADESRILAVLRDTLLPKLISGELRVKNTEAVAGALCA